MLRRANTDCCSQVVGGRVGSNTWNSMSRLDILCQASNYCSCDISAVVGPMVDDSRTLAVNLWPFAGDLGNIAHDLGPMSHGFGSTGEGLGPATAPPYRWPDVLQGLGRYIRGFEGVKVPFDSNCSLLQDIWSTKVLHS